jgi:hypothetical protein
MPLDDIPFHQPHKVVLEVLRFDPENPRFTPDSDLDGTNDVDVIKFFYRTADLGELLQSIASSGYIDIEPLIVLARDDRLIVLARIMHEGWRV